MCKVSRCKLTKLEAIQARHHMQHATTYNSAKLEQAHRGDVLIIYTYVLETGTWFIFIDIMCKLSRCNSTKLEAIQARHHTQHATTYNSAKLEQAPVMVE